MVSILVVFLGLGYKLESKVFPPVFLCVWSSPVLISDPFTERDLFLDKKREKKR